MCGFAGRIMVNEVPGMPTKEASLTEFHSEFPAKIPYIAVFTRLSRFPQVGRLNKHPLILTQGRVP